jgi:hypothetical protein
VDVGVANAGGSHDLLLFAESILKLGLEERRDVGQLKVDNVLLQALGIPQSYADPFAVDFRLEVLRREGRVLGNCAGGWRRGIGALPSRQSERSAEEFDERGLAAAFSAEDEDAVGLLAYCLAGTALTYLKGVGSFLLLTRRGVLTVLI